MNFIKAGSNSFAGLMIMLLAGMISTAILTPNVQSITNITSLPVSMQLAAVLICSLVWGSETGIIIIIAYLTLGLFYLPIFHGGGSLGYILTPEFGYLAGFIPSAGLIGYLSKTSSSKSLIQTTFIAIIGVITIHIFGILSLFFGSLLSIWSETLINLITTYSITPLPWQLLLCPAVSIITLALRKLLFIK